MSSLMAAIREAVRPGSQTHALETLEGEPGASALNPASPLAEASTTGGDMSETRTLAGAATPAAAVLATVTAAASGGQDGYTKAMDRMGAILSADGIKGDGKRMSAALDLAKASPDMAAEAVVNFVTANVSASADADAATAPAASAPVGQTQAAAYEHQRLAAAALAAPGGGQKPADNKSVLQASVARRNNRR